MIGVVDYSACNINASLNLLSYNGIPASVVRTPKIDDRFDAYILPGNGHFDICAAKLDETGFKSFLTEEVLSRKKPVLGICVGAQLMGVGSDEGSLPGLGWLPFECKKFEEDIGLPVPNMGWRPTDVSHCKDRFLSTLEAQRYYFMHSYYIPSQLPETSTVTSHYGLHFSAAFKKENIIGVQFHPEKSHKYGASFIKAFNGFVRQR